MESLSIGSSSFPKNLKLHKHTTSRSLFLFTNSNLSPISSFSCPNPTQFISHFTKKNPKSVKTLITHHSNSLKNNIPNLKIQSLSLLFVGLPMPLSCFASEVDTPLDQSSNKINLEAIVVSIDDFFNKYPFFVAGVVFIWLFVIPVTQDYLRKYKFISAINAFKKLKEDPTAQLLDIRDKKTLRVMGSPNLKILSKNVVQVEFRDGDEQEFVKKVQENFKDPENTTVCILDNFDGNSMKVAELLFNNGFKEAYAIRGGVRGNSGWQEIQETLLPPSVHIYTKRKVKESKSIENNGPIKEQSEVKSRPSSVSTSKQTKNGYVNVQPNASTERSFRSSSPYSMYPDMKPPSSPTPSKPQK